MKTPEPKLVTVSATDWVTVPREATEDMEVAGAEAYCGASEGLIAAAYAAMLTTAPPAPTLSADLTQARQMIAGLVEALENIANESVFNQQRFAEDTDTDYFLRCFMAVKGSARTALTAAKALAPEESK